MSTNKQSNHPEQRYTCTQLRDAGMLQEGKAPACCTFCHTRTHEGKERQDTMYYEQTPEGRLLVLCCRIDNYLVPIDNELDNELKVIEGHIGA